MRTVPGVSSATPRLCRAPGLTTSTGRPPASAARMATLMSRMPCPVQSTTVLRTSVRTSGGDARLADRTPPDAGHVARGLMRDAVLAERRADGDLLVGDCHVVVGLDRDPRLQGERVTRVADGIRGRHEVREA